VRIDSPPASLRPGLTANADIYVEKRENVLVIPLQAVTMREVKVDADGKYIQPDPAELERMESGEAKDGAPAATAAAAETKDEPKKELEGVFLRDGDRARFRPIKLGIKGEAEVEVEEGLAEGDEIITGSYKILRTLKEWDLIAVEQGASSTLARSRPGHRR